MEMKSLLEAAKQALEALDKLKASVIQEGRTPEHWDSYYHNEEDAAEALRQAIAETEK
jgi:hypothetical protein